MAFDPPSLIGRLYVRLTAGYAAPVLGGEGTRAEPNVSKKVLTAEILILTAPFVIPVVRRLDRGLLLLSAPVTKFC